MTLGGKTFVIPFNSFLMSSIFTGVHTFRYGSQVEKILRNFSSVPALMNSYGKCHLKQFFDHSKAFRVSAPTVVCIVAEMWPLFIGAK